MNTVKASSRRLFIAAGLMAAFMAIFVAAVLLLPTQGVVEAGEPVRAVADEVLTDGPVPIPALNPPIKTPEPGQAAAAPAQRVDLGVEALQFRPAERLVRGQTVAPTQGSDKRGPTAAVKSVAKLDHVACDSGTLLNQKFHPAVLKDMPGLRKLAALIRTYFDLKGMHIQFNVISRETLVAAQRHPERYANLIVRVAGYSALFTSLEPAVQEDIIARTEHSM